MDLTDTSTKTLLALWNNVLEGFDKIAESLDSGTFNTPIKKGAAPPSQSGQTTLWFALAIDAELTKRGVPYKKIDLTS